MNEPNPFRPIFLTVLVIVLLAVSCRGHKFEVTDFSEEKSDLIRPHATYSEVVSILRKTPGDYAEVDDGHFNCCDHIGAVYVYWENDTDRIGVFFDKDNTVISNEHCRRLGHRDRPESLVTRFLRWLKL